jgi:serine/threonine-protein kinase RsbW
MSIWWSLHLRREAASVPLARRLLLSTMEAAGVEPEIAFDLSIALSEACANAVEHGGGGDAGDAYRVTAFIDGDTCRIEVIDFGTGFAVVPDRSGASDGPVVADECVVDGPVVPDEYVIPERRAARPAVGRSQQAKPPAPAPAAPWAASAAAPSASAAAASAPALAEHGRGLFLIEALTDHVRYRGSTGRNGAVVSFDKILKWRADSLLKAS